MSLEALNDATGSEAIKMFRQCCSSEVWVAKMVSGRPYMDAAALHVAADDCWKDMAEGDYLQAFEGHPKIGDVGSLKEKYANTEELASGEQSSVDSATDDTIRKLAEGNARYEKKFGFIFIVCATGKSAKEMSSLLQARLPNDRAAELKNAAEEQRKIFHLRLEKLL
ncbi:MAG TPA: 2-oxo-4-hydroxy-4-carboxy-5-ureidoimidazoline decarboxylase [Gammaproteobacteria bacterium]|nr:2-oxo-4-hydroxy-4-carboxy-5-ureidoimidazoline decarboxylase [Gammaproteobacteria bacterium]